MKNVGQLKDGVAGLLQATSLDNITNLNGAIERAARILSQNVDIPEASARSALTLYDEVYDYVAPTDIFGGTLIDLRPQGISRVESDSVFRGSVSKFDRTKHLLPNGYDVAFEYNKGTPLIRVAQTKTKARTVIDTLQETTDWTAAGSASALTKDETIYYKSPSALRFLLTGSSTGTLTKTLSSPLSMAAYEDVGVVFLAIRTPSTSSLTNITIRIGSDSSNYDSVTETDGFLGSWTINEWLLVAFDMSGSTSTGTPDWSAIDYIQIRIAHTATITNFYVGYLFAALPSPHELIYKTAAIFNHSSTLSNTITDDNDTVLLGDAAFNLFEHEAALSIAFQSGGTFASGVVQNLRAILYGAGNEPGLYSRYKSSEPGDTIRFQSSYYNLRANRRGRSDWNRTAEGTA